MPEYRRTTAASLGSLTLLAGLTGVTALPATAAAAPTCQGQTATIVSSDARVTGTEGADVIVASAPTAEVHGLGGNDVICIVSGLAGAALVDAGAGDDVVDTTGVAALQRLEVRLGAGADQFLGGPAHETVTTDAEGSAEDDVVETAAGQDHVDSGTDGFANGDTIALGADDDHVRLRATDFTGTVKDGGGTSELTIGDAEGSFTVDASTGQVTRDGEEWAPLGVQFQRFQVAKSKELEFKGSDRAERLATGPGKVIDMGGGDDVLDVSGAPRQGDVLEGSAGDDRISVRAEKTELDVDLGTGNVAVGGAGAGTASATLRGFESHYLKAHRLDVRGTQGDDALVLTACETTAKLLGGNDSVRVGPDTTYDETAIPDCADPTTRLNGGSGNDTLRGSSGDDRVRGGKGDDEISTGDGRDRIWGGQGDDKVSGGTHGDEIWGGSGRDILRGNKGRDKIWGGDGGDTVKGGQGHDELWGGKGPDTLVGNKGRDKLWGNKGHDLLKGSKSNDRMWGGPGADQARGGQGYDQCNAETRRSCEG